MSVPEGRVALGIAWGSRHFAENCMRQVSTVLGEPTYVRVSRPRSQRPLFFFLFSLILPRRNLIYLSGILLIKQIVSCQAQVELCCFGVLSGYILKIMTHCESKFEFHKLHELEALTKFSRHLLSLY